MGFGAILCVALVLKQALADLRIASQPRRSFRCEWGEAGTTCSLQERGKATKYIRENGQLGQRLGPFVYNASDQPEQAPDIQIRYWEPSTFNYTGLGKIIDRDVLPENGEYPTVTSGERVDQNINNGGQKTNNYDQFLRSNIDNEQDNRDFDTEDGMDHLPFRTWNASDNYLAFRAKRLRIAGPPPPYGTPKTKDYEIFRTMTAGDSLIVPLRWNNPHSAEMEVNIWIFAHAGKQPIVVPIRKPTCSGEGYQDNVIRFTIPKDFSELGSKIPGFNGCNEDTYPYCTLQIYSHSVESRTYALAFPIFVLGHKASRIPAKSIPDELIEPSQEDPGVDLSKLRPLCRAANDPEAEIQKAVPRWARLVSDVYNHAYMNSDYSPYHGQQHNEISQNMQASAINKMVTGNRGELGKSILPLATWSRLRQLQLLEDRLYKNYETLANNVINKIGSQLINTGDLRTTFDGEPRKWNGGYPEGEKPYSTAYLAKCFRCAETGSMLAQRLETNTYIPSFQMPSFLVNSAMKLVPEQYSNLIMENGRVQIYVATLNDLLPFYQASQVYGIIYQTAMLKSTIDTMADITKFKKLDALGNTDKGVYAATAAKVAVAKKLGCDHRCIKGDTTNRCGGIKQKPIIKGSAATCVTGDVCAKCQDMFVLYQHDPQKVAPLTKLALGIIAHGRPPTAGAGVQAYPDADGSPRFGRARFGSDEIIVPTPEPMGGSAWASDVKDNNKPIAGTPKPPSPVTSKRRRRGGARRRRRRSAAGGSRRRSPKRRRRGSKAKKVVPAALEQLFQEVRSQHAGNPKLA